MRIAFLFSRPTSDHNTQLSTKRRSAISEQMGVYSGEGWLEKNVKIIFRRCMKQFHAKLIFAKNGRSEKLPEKIFRLNILWTTFSSRSMPNFLSQQLGDMLNPLKT